MSPVSQSLLFLAVICAGVIAQQTCPSPDLTLAAKYVNCKVLASNQYELYWTYQQATSSIDMAIRVQTTGWAGFGISPDGGMPNSDMAIGWVNGDGTVVLNDHRATAQARPPLDSAVGGNNGDWMLQTSGGSTDGTWTVLEFTRLLVTGDTAGDRDIVEGNNRVVYAWNNARPTDASNIMYHGMNRGTQGLAFFEDGQALNEINSANTLTFKTNNITIPQSSTTYWCSGYRLPSSLRNNTGHLIYFNPVIPAASLSYTHHMILYSCPTALNANLGRLSPAQMDGGPCDSSAFRACQTGPIVAAWAVGGGAFQFPDDVSFSFGGPEAPEYFMIQSHFNNPSMVSGVVDSSGFELRYLDQARMFDGGVLEVGYTVSDALLVPPGASRFSIFGVCESSCTGASVPCDGITVFGNTLHTHLAGRSVTLRQYRNGQEVTPTFDQNLNYDFNFQDIRTIGPKKIMPGDMLILECVYDNPANHTLVGGQATTDEMCLSFLNYYPRIPVGLCLSQATANAFLNFSGSLSAAQQQELGAIYVGTGMDLSATADRFTWDSQSMQKLQKAYEIGEKSYVCSNKPTETVCESSGALTVRSGVVTMAMATLATVVALLAVK